jgi:hypothetical protein
LPGKRSIFILSLTMVLLLAACGKKGDPLPVVAEVPGGISDVTGEVKDGVLFLSFTVPTRNKDGSNTANLAGFKIRKRCGTCMGDFEQWKEVRLDEKRGFTVVNGRLYVYDNDLAPGYQYSYKIVPFTRRGSHGDDSNLFTITWQAPPAAPEVKVTVQENDGKVELTWTREGEFSYDVYRSDDDQYPLFPLNKSPLTKPYVLDTGLENGKTYVYEIRRVMDRNGMRWEGDGVKVRAVPRDKTPPAIPRGVKAERHEDGVRISWQPDAEPDLAGYNVFRVVSGKGQRLNREPVQKPPYVDHEVQGFRYLSYYVTAIDAQGNESEPSRESTVVLKE